MSKPPIKSKSMGGLKRFLIIPIAFACALLYWLSLNYQAIKEVIGFTNNLFSFSLIPILSYLLLFGLVIRYHPRLLWRRWRFFLGLGVLVLAICGMLSLFDMGGKIGEIILAKNYPLAIARLIILSYVSLLLIIPSVSISISLWAMRKTWRGLSRLFYTCGKIPPKMESLLLKKGKPVKEGVEVKDKSGAKPERGEAALPVRKPTPHEPLITPSGWRLPPLEMLSLSSDEGGGVDVEEMARRLEEALLSYGVEGKVVGINIGPTVTQFEVEPGWERRFKEVKEQDKNGNIRTRKVEVSRTRVKVEKIQSLSSDLALSLAAPSIRIEAPVPGKSVVGIEIPNLSPNIVTLGSVMNSPQFNKLRSRTSLALALGKGAGGENVVIDLVSMPHLLIAGATGSGKTVCLNSFICCLLMTNTPEQLNLLLIDPKRVEFVHYNPVPHLLMPVVVDMDRAVEALRWLENEMDARYKKFSEVGARDIQGYNRSATPQLPYIVLVIDELADLMMSRGGEVEGRLCRLAQLSRATGIHLIVATQRPSVDVVTGLIKANFPSRISFSVASQADSRTILDMAGAEKLLGRGDMLFLPQDATRPKRIQGCFISEAEIKRIVDFWSKQKGDEHPEPKEKEEDPLLSSARRLALEYKRLSPSFLQRRLQIGYTRAVKLIEELEKEGLIKRD